MCKCIIFIDTISVLNLMTNKWIDNNILLSSFATLPGLMNIETLVKGESECDMIVLLKDLT